MNKKLQKCLSVIIMTLIIVIGRSYTTYAQEAGYFNHYYIQPILINPGATGFNGDHELLAAYKINYSDFPGAPRTFTALYNGSFAEKAGLGIQVLSDHIGASQILQGQLNFAYRLIFPDAVIGLGLSTGIQNFKITDTQNDALIDPTDVLLNEAIDGYLIFDGSVGVYGEVDKKLIFGVSFPNLVKQRIQEISGDLNRDSLNLNNFPYVFNVGYRYNVENYNFTIEPSITVKDLRDSPFLVDLNLKFSFLDEQLVGGLGYSIGDDSRASLLLGTRINKLRLYYSYDVNVGNFQKYNNGSHEFTLVYRIPSKSSATTTTE